MGLRPGSRRAEEFARLLDGDGRTDDPGLAPLLALSEALRAMPVEPRAEFRDALRQRLVAVASVDARPAPPRPAHKRVLAAVLGWRGQRRLAAVTGALAVALVLAGVGVGASRSLPGQLFYPVKRTAEAAHLLVTSGHFDRGRLHLEFARTRLQEVQRLTGSAEALGPTAPGPAAAGASAAAAPEVADTLQAMDEQVRAGTRDLTLAYTDDGRSDALTLLHSFASEQRSRLAELLPSIPGPAAADARGSLALLQRVDGETGTLLEHAPACAEGCGPTSTRPAQPTRPTPPGSGHPTPSPAPSSEPSRSTGQAPAPRTTTVPAAPAPQPAAPGPAPADGGLTGIIDDLTGGLQGVLQPPASSSPPSLPLPKLPLPELPLPKVTVPPLTNLLPGPSTSPQPSSSPARQLLPGVLDQLGLGG